MLNYIIRRILLMVPTLFGITIMVFLIARAAPGQPGAQSFGEGGNQMKAEGRKALREAAERKFGLDLPLHKQYFRWWRGMFINDTEAFSWTTDYEPIYTLRLETKEYYTVDPNGQWYALYDADAFLRDDAAMTPVTDVQAAFSQDAEFLSQIPQVAKDRNWVLATDPIYPTPQHLFVTGNLIPTEALPTDLLAAGTRNTSITVIAPAWTNVGGYPVYEDPADANRLIYPRNGDWYEITPTKAEDRWERYSQDDPSFKSKIEASYFNKLPAIVDGRPIPRHLGITGKVNRLEGEQFDEATLQRKELAVEASIDSMMWVKNGQEFWPVTTPRAPEGINEKKVSIKVVQNAAGQWERLIGESRLVEPEYERFDEEDFLPLLPEEARGEFENRGENDPAFYHVVMKGEQVALPPGTELGDRDVRKYSLPIDVFEITLGKSITSHSTVLAEMKNRLGITLRINIIAFLIIYTIAIPGGMLMAMKRGKMFDSGANITLLALWSVPSVLSATLFIGYLGEGGNWMHWFPTNGLKSNDYDQMSWFGQIIDQGWHLVLPITCMVYAGFAYLAKQMRASMLENFTMDYVRTAKAKGVSVKRIVLVHVLRNSLIPLITIVATLLPAMIAGAVIIETIFNIEGMGLFTFRAVQNRDFDVVQSMALIAGALNLTGLLLADIMYAIADPRIRYS